MIAGQLGTVLVTGAGGAAAVTVLRSLQGHATLVAADIDPVAVGLYLTDASRRVLLPRGDAPEFVDTLLTTAIEHGVDLVVPTVDTELRGVSAARERFAAHGIAVLVESTQTLDMCLDKLELVRACETVVRVPVTVLLQPDTTDAELRQLGEPFIVKPRRGAGGRGFEILTSSVDVTEAMRDGTIIAQEMLPGDEYSIDVLARPGGGVVAAVPRRRDKVDSGIAVAGRTVSDPALESFGREVAQVIGAQGVVNVQAKMDATGRPALLEVNARFPGAMALTQAAGHRHAPASRASPTRPRACPSTWTSARSPIVRHWEDIVVPVAGVRARPVCADAAATTGWGMTTWADGIDRSKVTSVDAGDVSGLRVDHGCDLHTHSRWTDGQDTPQDDG